MPFDSRKQQKWYHATNQTFYDDEPHSARLVKKGGNKSEEGEDPEFKDLTTSAGGDLDPQNKNLQTTQGSMRESLEFEGENYILSPEGYTPRNEDLIFENRIYIKEITEEEKSLKRGEPVEASTYKEMRESLLKNDVKQIIAKAIEEFKEDEHPRDGGKFTSKGGGSSGKSEEPKRFTFAQYERNESKNRHAINALNLVKQYGTPEEVKEIEEINTRHKKEGKLKWDDLKRRTDISDKYYDQLEKESGESAAKAIEEFKEEDHPRDGGKFTTKGGGSSSTTKEKPKETQSDEDVWSGANAKMQHLAMGHAMAGVGDGIPDKWVNSKGDFRVPKWSELNKKQKKSMSDALRKDLKDDFYKGYGDEEKANEEGLASVSGPPADSTMRVMSNKVYVKKDEESLTDEDLTKEDLTDKVLGESLEFEGENYVLSPRGYSPIDKDLIFEGKIYKAEEGLGNCEFCAGKGQVTVENLGIKDCPDCDGTGDIQQPNPVAPDITGQMDPNAQPQVPPQQVPQPDQPTQQAQIPQQPMQDPNQAQSPPQQAPEEKEFPPKEEKPKFGESKQKPIACEKSMKQYRGYIARKIEVLKKRAKANEAVSVMYGLPTIEKQGKKIKGILAYAGVSLNDRIYLPEELAKGHGLTLPLLLNHSNIAGAEEELDRLDDDMVNHLENEKDFKIGEVTLDWDQEKLTLFYEGVIEHPFFQKEVDDADMAVSLGIYYDSDSPVVCDDNCYTIIKGAEFREVSLVYHPGFPIATIEAVENELKEVIMKKQKAKEDHLEKLNQLKKNEEEEQVKGEDETEDIKLIADIIQDTKETDDAMNKVLSEKLSEENEEDIIITDEPEILDQVTQIPAEDWNAESLATEANFSIRGINGFTISNSNGVTRYKLDPTNGYENNWLHVNVNKAGAKLFGEGFQLQPKMTTPPELTKEIENRPDIKFTDSDADAFKKKAKT